MIGQADSDDGVRKPGLIWQKQADNMAITRGKKELGLRSLAQDKELCSDNLVSFFKELDTRQGTVL